MSGTRQARIDIHGTRNPTVKFVSAVQDLEQVAANDSTDDLLSDDEIDNIRELLHRSNYLLNRMSNARRGANRLPAELLRVVFLQALRPIDLSRYVKTLPDEHKRYPSVEVGWQHEHKRVGDVLTFAHVSTHWRSVALAFPELWQSISTINRSAASMFLARAGGKHLHVFAMARESLDAGSFTDMCAECAPKMRQLLWVSPQHGWGHDRQFAMSELDIKAPMLERLCMARGIGDMEQYRSRSIFCGDTSSVKYLSIVDLRWLPRNQFPALTHLVLTGRINALDLALVKLLKGCPNMQTFVCKATAQWVGMSDPIHIVRLPHLRQISLGSPSLPDDGLFDFLASLDFDRSRAAVQVSFGAFTTDAIGNERSLLVAPPPAQAIHGADVGGSAPYTHLYLKQVAPPRVHQSSFTMFTTSATGGLCLKGDTDIHRSVYFSFALQHITELWVDGLTKDVPQVLMLWRRVLPALRTVVIVRRPPPPSEVPFRVPAPPLSYVEEVLDRARRGPGVGESLVGTSHAREVGMRVIDDSGRRWESEEGVFAHLKTIIGLRFMQGTGPPVRMFVSDGQGSVTRTNLDPWVTVTGLGPPEPAWEGETEEMPTTMPIPEVCRKDPDFTAWEAW